MGRAVWRRQAMKLKIDDDDLIEIKDALVGRMTTWATLAKGAKKRGKREEYLGKKLKTELVLVKLEAKP
jgi:hypothetical protein